MEESPAQEKARLRREKLLAAGADRMKMVAEGHVVSETEEKSSSSVVATSSIDQQQQQQTPEEKAKLRREKLLAKSEERMKIVAGELKIEQKTEMPTTPNTPVDNRPRWEQKYEKDLAVVKEERQLNENFMSRLEVTAQLAVEAPKTQGDEKVINISKVTPIQNSLFSELKLDSFLTSITIIVLGIFSGQTNGNFVQDYLWLPFGSLVFLALFLRVIISQSLNSMNLGKKKTNSSSSSSNFFDGGLLSMGMKFLPPPISQAIQRVIDFSGFIKDSNDDMMLFVFAHGISTIIVKSA